MVSFSKDIIVNYVYKVAENKRITLQLYLYQFIPTIHTSFLVPLVDEQVSGAFWEPWQGKELNEARNGITGKKVMPT